ncbi:MAG: histidine kinase N-terminal 7TM domain-containing protein [Halobacterium sp.]
MQLTAGLALSALSAVVSVAVAAFAWRRDAPGSRGVAAFSVAAAVWAGGNAVQLAVTSLDAKLLAVTVQYVGIGAMPLAWFAFAAEYTGREEWASARVLGALAVVPAVLLVLVATNGAHHLVRESARLETVEGAVRIAREFGPAFWIAVAYSNVVNAAGTVMLLDAVLRVGREHRRQTVVVLAGATVPWLANVAYLGGGTNVEPEAFLGVTALAFGYAIARYELFELVPVARDRVFEELGDGVLVLDGDGRVVDYNAAAERLLDADLAVGDAFEDAAPDAVAAAARDDAENPVGVDPDGAARWVTVRTGAVRENTPGSLVVLRDVTELQRQRHELDRENERLERVADTISHDLRNPLSVATGYLELVEESGDPEAVERAADALDRMDDIVEGTLRMARAGLDDPDVSTVPLADVARRAWGNVPTGGATLEVAAEDAVVRADPEQLERLLENVFRNSVEHGAADAASRPREDSGGRGAAPGGGVTVTVGATDDGFYVADDGVGVPEDDRAAVFERGYTTDEDGTGLGLAIVRDIADAHGWQVAMTDSDAGGVRVAVTGVQVAEESRPQA